MMVNSNLKLKKLYSDPRYLKPLVTSIFTFFIVTSDSVNAQSDCYERIEKPVASRFPNHQERIIERYGKCTVTVNYSLNENGVSDITGSTVENTDCRVFQRNAEKSVSQYLFKKGTEEKCEIKITFMIEGYDSN